MTGAAIQKLSMIFENRAWFRALQQRGSSPWLHCWARRPWCPLPKKDPQREVGKSGCALNAQPSSWPELQCCWKSGHYLKTKKYIVFPPDTLLRICACAHHSCLHIQSGWCRCRRLRCLEDQQASQDRGNSRDRIRSAQQMPFQKQTAPSNQKQPVQFIHQYPSIVVCESIDARIACT